MKYSSKEQKIAKLKELVEHFGRNFSDYKNKAYKEAKVRIDFLDPFFGLICNNVCGR
jgi:predicted secreted acid phosphatase